MPTAAGTAQAVRAGQAGAPGERFDAFRDLVSSTFVPLRVEPARTARPEPFEGRLRSLDLGAIRVCHVSATPHTVFRTPALIARSDPEYYKVGLQLRGPCQFTQGDREIVLTPGDFTIYDTGRPYAMRFDEPYQQLVLMLPRTMLRLPADRVAQIAGRRVPGTEGVAALLSALLRQLAVQFDTLGRPSDIRLADNILDLLATVYTEEHEGPAPDRRPLLLTILSYIERHLSDPHLTPDRIAAAHYISTRYLHKLFHEEQTTVAGWIRERRLAHCRHDLRDRSLATRPVSVIAAAWGFAEPAHFSRVFRAAFGTTPNAYRNA